MPALSLIVPTRGRVGEVNVLLDSLCLQQGHDFELIVVDQNQGTDLGELLSGRCWPFPVIWIHTPDQRGASRARNVGLTRATGEVVLFPDDDCWYPADFMARGLALMRASGADFVCGRPADGFGRSINGRFERRAQAVNAFNVWTTQIEWTVFFKRERLIATGGYNEEIGVGAATPWQAAEGQEITLRMLRAGASGIYDPDLVAHHKEFDIVSPSAQVIAKARQYGRGMGRVLRLGRAGAASFFGWWMLRPLGGALIWAARGSTARARYYLNVAVGRLEGWRGRLL